MDEAKILAATYKDKAFVYRLESYQDEAGETKERKKLVYENIPCAISQSKNDVPERGEGVFPRAQEYVLFTCPDIRIGENDYVQVITEAGERYEGRSGKTFVYPASHGETKLKVEGIA